MFDTILFDLDGTLVQHGYVLLPQKLHEWGHPRTHAAVEASFLTQIGWVYEIAPTLFDDRSLSKQESQSLWEDLWRQVCHRVVCDLAIDEGGMAERLIAHFQHEPTPPLFHDVLPLLNRASTHGWKMGIITQRDRIATERFLHDHGVRNRFPVIVAGDDGHGRKPDAAPFLQALAQLDSRPENTVFVGDRVDDDCGGACAANVSAFLIDRATPKTRTPQHNEPSFLHLRSLLELPSHLLQESEIRS